MKKYIVVFVFLCCMFIGKVEADREVIKEGVGINLISVGHKKVDIVKNLGAGEKDSTNTWLNYRKKRGIDVFLGNTSGGMVAREVRFNKGCKYRLATKIGVGSSMKNVFKKYGEPLMKIVYTAKGGAVNNRYLFSIKGKDKKNVWKICYNTKGILFWFDNKKKVKQFVVFKPSHNEIPTSFIQCPCCKKRIMLTFGKTVVGYVE